jgi:hypothetical protein
MAKLRVTLVGETEITESRRDETSSCLGLEEGIKATDDQVRADEEQLLKTDPDVLTPSGLANLVIKVELVP